MTFAKESKDFLLLYGTQTGNAKAIAEKILDIASNKNYCVILESLSAIGEKVIVNAVEK